MPRLDYRVSLRELFSPQECQIVRVTLRLLNEVRAHLDLPALTEEALLQRVRESQSPDQEGGS